MHSGVSWNGKKYIKIMPKKKYHKGLIIGKFYPLHLGHCYLIEKGLAETKHLVVIVCQTSKYKIPASIRASWIRKLYPEVEVKIFKHDVTLDSDSVRLSKKWAHITTDFLGYSPDVVFSSEDYGKAYAFYMGSKHVLVDKKRNKFNISGTKIRKDPYKYWKYLPPPVKAYFTKRIVVLGAESTGTTTLAKDLAMYYKTAWVPEYGRSYCEGKMFLSTGQKWNTKEFIHIADMQNNVEEEMAGLSDKFLICDTDPLATTIWHRRYVGNKSSELENLVHTNKYSLYILTATDIPFVQDGTRDGERLREWMHRLFLEELKKRKLKYIMVQGGKNERLQNAIAAIKQLPDKYYYN